MLLSAVCNGKVPCVLCDRMLTFLRLYSICGNLRGSVTHWYSTALQFRQMIYFIRLFRHPFRRKATMASFCCGRSPGHTIIRSRHNGRRGSAAVFSQPPGGGGDHGELVHATADDGATMDDREPGAYCFANEPEDIGLVCCGQTRETKAAQSSTAPPWWLL